MTDASAIRPRELRIARGLSSHPRPGARNRPNRQQRYRPGRFLPVVFIHPRVSVSIGVTVIASSALATLAGVINALAILRTRLRFAFILGCRRLLVSGTTRRC